jgi:hypothetical protein
MDMLKKVVSTAVILIAIGFVQRANASVLGSDNVGFDVAQASTQGGPILLAIWYPTSAHHNQRRSAAAWCWRSRPKAPWPVESCRWY